MPRDEKLYVLTRADLSPGMQAAQAAHAAFHFAVDHPALTERWVRDSNYLILLGVPDEGALLRFVDQVDAAGVENTLVREPDLRHEATALAVAPSTCCRLFSNLPLLGRGASRDLDAVPAAAVRRWAG